MDIHSPTQEKLSKHFKEQIHFSLGLSHFEVSFSLIDSMQKTILAASTDYQWHLGYWDANLDKKLSQRLVPGIATWDDYGRQHIDVLREYKSPDSSKVDICTQHDNLFELLSITLPAKANFRQISQLFSIKPAVSALASKIFKQHSHEVLLPFRGQTKLASPVSFLDKENRGLQHANTYQFGDLRLTTLEMDTIRLLLMHRSIKEIANLHKCHEKVERKRLNNIKRKTGGEFYPMSYLFDQLQKHGVIQACLNSYIIFR